MRHRRRLTAAVSTDGFVGASGLRAIVARMSGEAGFTVTSELYSLFVGAGVSVNVAVGPSGAGPAEYFARANKALKKRYERAAHDVVNLLESLRDDDQMPLVPLVPVEGDRLQIEHTGRDAHRFELQVSTSRPLTDRERAALTDGVVRLLWPPLSAVRKVHHVSCASFCPLGGALYNDHKKLVCHCLVVETEQGLVLVDTGLGSTMPMQSSAAWRAAWRPDVADGALSQVRALGFQASDVQHIVLTHLDLDHAGGLADFPHAAVHVMRDEHAAAHAASSFVERARYLPSQWAHDVKWRLHDGKGERWYGFPCVRDLPGLLPEILLVPLPGHTRGHAAVAVDVGGHWLLHCGDAYFHKDEMDHDDPWCSPMLRLHQRLMAVDDVMRRKNQQRLRELSHGVGAGIDVFCAHDPDDLARLRGG